MADVDLREFLTAFVAEADDQIRVATTKLLALEGAIRNNEREPRAVRELFRALHTIKGLAAMVGVDAIVTLAHHLETLLRRADRAQTMPEIESIDVMLDAVRAIETAVRNVEAGKPVEPPNPRLVGALEALDQHTASLATAAPKALDLDPRIVARLAPFERELLASPAPRRAVRADFTPSPQKAERGLSISAVRERLAAIAEIVKVVPISVEASADAPGALSFAILMLTDATNTDIAHLVGIEPSDVLDLVHREAPPEPAPRQNIDATIDLETTPDTRNVVRVDVVRLDDAMEHLSSLLVTRSRMSRALGELASRGVPVRDLNEIMREQNRQLRDLRGAILRMRMVPVQEVLQRVPLIVRGLERATKKQVSVEIQVGDAELDKRVAERLFPAIVHLVRNAVDHGIEDSEYRVRSGKPAAGRLRIATKTYSKTQLDLSISDDGRGVDREAVSRRIGERIDDSDASLLLALCRAGMSTRDEATATSGRGMGMDIVRRIVVDQLGGELTMTTEKGVGTTFTMRIPLSISIIDAFTLACDGQAFAVPVAMVEEILEVDPARVTHMPSRGGGRHHALIQRRGETVPLLDLARTLALPTVARDASRGHRQAVVVRRDAVPMAFELDRVTGQQEAVVRPIIDPLVQVTGISGSTDLGDGKPTLVLDLVSLGGKFLGGEVS